MSNPRLTPEKSASDVHSDNSTFIDEFDNTWVFFYNPNITVRLPFVSSIVKMPDCESEGTLKTPFGIERVLTRQRYREHYLQPLEETTTITSAQLPPPHLAAEPPLFAPPEQQELLQSAETSVPVLPIELSDTPLDELALNIHTEEPDWNFFTGADVLWKEGTFREPCSVKRPREDEPVLTIESNNKLRKG